MTGTMTLAVVMAAIGFVLIVWIVVLNWRLRTYRTTVRIAGNAAAFAVGDCILVAGRAWRIASIEGNTLTCKLEAPRFTRKRVGKGFASGDAI